MIDRSLLQVIHHVWEKSQWFAERGVKAPDIDDLQALVECVFFASVQREEGEPVRVRVLLLPGDEAQAATGAWREHRVAKFDRPVALTPENLAKLAPAFDPNLSGLLAVRDSGSRDSYLIVGSIFYGRHGSATGYVFHRPPRPDVLAVSATAPGAVVVLQGQDVIGRIQRGRFVEASVRPLGSQEFDDQIVSVIQNHADFENYPDSDYVPEYLHCLSRLWELSGEHGHGATIVWVPESSLEAMRSILGSHRAIKHVSLTALVRRHYAQNAGTHAWHETAHDLTESLESVVNLSRADGALIVDDFLRPIAFAARLAAPRWVGKVRPGPVAFGESPRGDFPIQRYGTRHQSAVDFVGSLPGTVAFVASEDGPVRAMVAVGGTVFVWPDCVNGRRDR